MTKARFPYRVIAPCLAMLLSNIPSSYAVQLNATHDESAVSPIADETVKSGESSVALAPSENATAQQNAATDEKPAASNQDNANPTYVAEASKSVKASSDVASAPAPSSASTMDQNPDHVLKLPADMALTPVAAEAAPVAATPASEAVSSASNADHAVQVPSAQASAATGAGLPVITGASPHTLDAQLEALSNGQKIPTDSPEKINQVMTKPHTQPVTLVEQAALSIVVSPTAPMDLAGSGVTVSQTPVPVAANEILSTPVVPAEQSLMTPVTEPTVSSPAQTLIAEAPKHNDAPKTLDAQFNALMQKQMAKTDGPVEAPQAEVKAEPVSIAANAAPATETPKSTEATKTDDTKVVAKSAEPEAPKKVESTVNEATIPSEVGIDNGPKGGETIKVGVVSWRDMPFQTVRHQAFDYSCGSAAIATLMSYSYGIPTTERAVFKEMFDQGDKGKIRAQGFSMLDMSRYLNNHGLQANGYKITQNVIEKYKLPVIALINNNGYNHFVVVKTMNRGEVLVGDPNTGNKIYSREDFAKVWNGIALVVKNEGRKANEAFANQKEWQYARSHIDPNSPRENNELGQETAQLNPMQWQIAPTNSSISAATTIGLVGIVAAGNP